MYNFQHIAQGLRPPRGTTFEEWTKCEPFFRNVVRILFIYCIMLYILDGRNYFIVCIIDCVMPNICTQHVCGFINIFVTAE